MNTDPREWEEKERCDKCNGPFLAHHWKHYSPREDKTYHTACFTQYKFPSILAAERAALKWRIEGMKYLEVAFDAEHP